MLRTSSVDYFGILKMLFWEVEVEDVDIFFYNNINNSTFMIRRILILLYVDKIVL